MTVTRAAIRRLLQVLAGPVQLLGAGGDRGLRAGRPRFLKRPHHRDDLADLPGTAVERPVEHRDAAVPADRDPVCTCFRSGGGRWMAEPRRLADGLVPRPQALKIHTCRERG
jgi:hypothetical protein